MGIVRFALKFPYTFYVLAMFIVFLGVSATVMPEMEQRVTTYSQYSISTNVTGIKRPARGTNAMATLAITAIVLAIFPIEFGILIGR